MSYPDKSNENKVQRLGKPIVKVQGKTHQQIIGSSGNLGNIGGDKQV